MSKVYPYRVAVRRKWGRPYASVQDATGNECYTGEFRGTPEECLRDIAAWLEDKDYVHPLTHDLETA